MKNYSKSFFIVTLIVLAIFSRWMPHPPNFTPIAALSLLGAVHFTNKYTGIFLALAAMCISDVLIGFHESMWWVYGSFVAIGFVGFWLRANYSLFNTVWATLGSSVLFFIVTNFGVWLSSGMYAHTAMGFVSCYVAALPFFANTLLGDIFYVALLFGAVESAYRFIPSWQRLG